jgi:uncharacterized protein
MTNPVNWFEIAVTDMARAKKFYETVFNCTLTELQMGPQLMAMFPGEPGKPNAYGALVKADDYVPSATAGHKIYFTCEDVKKEYEVATQNGAAPVLPKTSLGEFGNMALFIDTEGNLIGLHSNK